MENTHKYANTQIQKNWNGIRPQQGNQTKKCFPINFLPDSDGSPVLDAAHKTQALDQNISGFYLTITFCLSEIYIEKFVASSNRIIFIVS